MRYAARRDGNEWALVNLAESLGATWVIAPPFDGWCWNPRTATWTPTEIKNPDGRNRYTPVQKAILESFKARGISCFVWRTESDVLRDLGAKRAA